VPPEDDNESDDEDDQTLPISKNGRCGKGIGRCQEGECCSKYGWCGSSEQHCRIDEGFNPTYGNCLKQSLTITVTKTATKSYSSSPSKSNADNTQWRCGKGIGSCPSGYCCSKYGWCGKTDEYCKLEEGCQSEFGLC